MNFHLIGAGHVAESIIKKKPKDKFKLYDNNRDLHNTELLGHIIYPVELIVEASKGEILICTTSVDEVYSQLSNLEVKIPVTIPDDINCDLERPFKKRL